MLCAFVALSVSAAAQSPEPLFIEGQAPASRLTDPGRVTGAIVDRTIVGMRIDRLFDGPDGVAVRILLNVGAQSWTAHLERIDLDTPGFRSWVGAIEGIPHSHVVFTERDGVVSGLINAMGATYQLRTHGPDTYLLERVDTSALSAELDPLHSPDITVPGPSSGPARPAADEIPTIDVLMLYTPNAREQSGGIAQIEALIARIMSDTNTAFVRSGVVARVRLTAVAEFRLNEASDMAADLESLRLSQSIRAGRDLVGADLVHLLTSSPDQFACGFGYLFDSLNDTDFDAYSVADVACAAKYSSTHEMAHNMGSNHAPEDGAFDGLFPYSYGFKDPVRGFRTVMAYDCVDVVCGRILNFSNPLVTHNGAPTGTPIQDNARSITNAAFTVANFRQPAASPSVRLDAPSGLRAEVSGFNVTLTWSAVVHASSYLLQVGTEYGRSDLFNASVGNTTVATGLVYPGTYYWRVQAQNIAGAGPLSAESQFAVAAACPIPDAPRNLQFSVSAGVVSVTWSAPASGSLPTTYIVEAGSASGLSDLLNTATAANFISATSVRPGTYFVRVRAQSSCGTSSASNEQLITVP